MSEKEKGSSSVSLASSNNSIVMIPAKFHPAKSISVISKALLWIEKR